MMVAHASQFAQSGDYRSFVIADIPFFIIRDEEGALRAFHNVCRHRAFTVVRKDCGNTLRLSCKYHGWQYGSTGRLIKAPHFMDQVGFDSSNNGLFEIHVKVDSSQFIFVNFATDLSHTFPWSDSAPALSINFDQDKVGEWEIKINVGWRTASKLYRIFAQSLPRLCLLN